ncbi:hypothetical protein HPP92_017760 [Vanilla planifolia]|uniref:Uncharacterized protein n=1 Tax=Vanilla planifolia TaxID=51239 RepID=A0A835UMP9_VANPL|nr:hypothetical protein HPP92_017760 [Vanilla planifolia]
MESIRASDDKSVENKEPATESSPPVPGCVRTNAAAKDSGNTVLNSMNKITAHIKKPLRRRSSSPLNWFPRKKSDSYLRRKIRLLQEGGFMSSSLVETLGNANPHYTRIAKEKIAAREAASKAMEARKAAMIEASWCRILQEARIPSGDAESKLEKAEQCAAEAFEEAKVMGVMMFDRPDCPRRPCEVQSLSSTTGGKSAHTISASFETAFEVDREVATAVRKALIKLANCSSSSNKEEFRELLRKISQNPLPQICSSSIDNGNSDIGRILECHEDTSSSSSQDLVNTMLERLKELHESDLESLATIVATCGLNSALLNIQSSQNDTERSSRRSSKADLFSYEYKRRKENTANVPSLDKFLVKHVSRLEREVLEARASKKISVLGCSDEQDSKLLKDSSTSSSTSELGSILIKHESKFAREIHEAKNSHKEKPKVDSTVISESNPDQEINPSSEHELMIEKIVSNDEQCVQSKQLMKSSEEFKQPNTKLDGFLSSNVADEKEESEPLNAEDNIPMLQFREITNRNLTKSVCSNKTISHAERAELETLQAFSCQNEHGKVEFQRASIDKVVANNREKMQAVEDENMPPLRAVEHQNLQKVESLDKIMVKHQSELQKAKLGASQEGDGLLLHKTAHNVEKMEGLGDILVKHQSKLEKAKLEAIQNSPNFFKHVGSRREGEERELQEAWEG